MKEHVYVLHDSVTMVYGQPHCARNDQSVMRSLSDAIAAPDARSRVATHPGDFVLYAIGMFDDDTGEFTPYLRRKVCDVGTLRQNPESVPRDVARLGIVPKNLDTGPKFVSKGNGVSDIEAVDPVQHEGVR